MALITPEGVLSYPKLFRSELPKDAEPGDKKKWSTTILFTQAAVETAEYKALVTEAIKCARDKWGADADQMIRDGQLRMPFRKDVAAKGYPAEFVAFMNLSKTDDSDKNVIPPQIIGRDAKPLTDTREIYPGVRARLSVGVFAYTRKGNKGVSFGLNNVQKLGDGPRIDNRKSAQDEFGAVEPEPAADMPEGGAADNLADLLR